MRGAAAAALRRATNEIPCPTEQLSLDELGSGGYRVEGCGVAITYTCFGTLCSPNERATSARTASTPGQPSPDMTWSDADVRALLDRLRQPVGACLPEGTDALRVVVGLSPRGQVRRVFQSRMAPATAACLDQVFEATRMSGQVPESRSVVLEFRRGDTGPALQTVESVPAPGAESRTPPSALGAHTPESAARAAIDARAPAILACVESDALSLQVSWSSEGRLDALLRGDRTGTPDEGCVRALVQQLSIAAPPSPGTIVHAIQR